MRGALLLLGALATPAWGAGFYLSEVGTPGSLGTAGIGNPTNTRGADTAWTNPAGMVGVTTRTMVGGMTLALPSVEFSPTLASGGGSDGGNGGVIAPIPGTFYVQPLGDDWRLGFALSAPLGGGFDYGDAFVGRYTLQELELKGAGVSSSLAWRVNDRFSVGAGLSLIYTTYSQDIALNQGPLPDGKIKIEDADDFGLQPYLGVLWQVSDRLRFGATYRAEFDADLKGDVKVENLLTVLNRAGTVKLEWTNPQWLDVGLRFEARDDVSLMVAGGWQDWSAFSGNRFAVAGQAGRANAAVLDRSFDDTWYLGAAFEKRFGTTSALSMGVKYDSSPVDDVNRTLDLPFDETWTLSASYAWIKSDALAFSVGGSLMLLGDAPIDQTSQGVRVVGDYDSNYIFFLGGNVRYEF